MVYPVRYRNATPSIRYSRDRAGEYWRRFMRWGGRKILLIPRRKNVAVHRMVKGLSKDVSVKSCVLLSGNSCAPGKRLNVPLGSLLLSFTDERAVVPRALWANFLRDSHSGVDSRNSDPKNILGKNRWWKGRPKFEFVSSDETNEHKMAKICEKTYVY